MKLVFVILVSLGFSSLGYSNSLWNYLRQYQVGISFAPVTDSIRIRYEVENSNYSETKTESLSQTDTGFSQCNGCGFFLQQAFKRQGNFYFNADLGLEVRALQIERENDTKYASSTIENASVSLYGGVVRPYIQFGLTPPRNLPDFLISIGPVYQLLWGSVSINDETHHTGISGIPAGKKTGLTGFLELELVLIRFGDGALSLFKSTSNASDNDFSSNNFFPKTVDNMTNFAATFSRNSSGIKLILNWP